MRSTLLLLGLLLALPAWAADVPFRWTASAPGSLAGQPDPAVRYALHACAAVTCPAPSTTDPAWPSVAGYDAGVACATDADLTTPELDCAASHTWPDPAPGQASQVQLFLVAVSAAGSTSAPSAVATATLVGPGTPPGPPGSFRVVQVPVVIARNGYLRVERAANVPPLPPDAAGVVLVTADNRRGRFLPW